MGIKDFSTFIRLARFTFSRWNTEIKTGRGALTTAIKGSLTQPREISGIYWRRPNIVHKFIRIHSKIISHHSLFFALLRFTVPQTADLAASRQTRAKITVDHEEGFPHKVLDLAQALLLFLFDLCCPRTSFISISIGFMDQLEASLTYFSLLRCL